MIIVFTVILVVGFGGLAYDINGAYQIQQHATSIAASASRAGTGALSGDIQTAGSGALGVTAATQLAESYLASAGVAGTATVAGDVITVTVNERYVPLFLGAFGVGPIAVQGQASAQLITGP